jgi:proteasome lid subunit RPN8/RPN11
MWFRLENEVAAQLARIAHQSAEARRERCGFLLGRQREEGLVAEAFAELPNLSPKGDRFQVHEDHARRVLAQAALAGYEVLAFVHSHVSGSVALSEGDLMTLAQDTLPWLIIGWNGALLMAVYAPGRRKGDI